MTLEQLIHERIVILDGAMGTQIGVSTLSDLLNLNDPKRIEDIHLKYLQAGADIIKTNTFNANSLSLEKYDLQHKVREINSRAVEIAKKAINHFGEHRFIAGVIGPTALSASSIKGFPSIIQDELTEVFYEQALILAESKIDLFLVETVYDLKNAQAALKAIERVMEKHGKIPVMLSVTISQEGKLLSGESLSQLIESIKPYSPFSVGLNCSYGSSQMGKSLKELSEEAPFWISVHPNAGLPDKKGLYPEDVLQFSQSMNTFIKEKWVNIVGGCCGTDETHIKALSTLAKRTKDVRRL